MRILFIAPQPFYEDRGTPIAVREILETLSDLGFSVDVATYPLGIEVKIPGIRLFRTANPLRYKYVSVGLSLRKIILDICLIVTVLRLNFRNKYDCIHAVEESAAIAILCKALSGTPVIYDMHSNFADQISGKKGPLIGIWNWLALRFESWLLKHSDCVVGSRGLASTVLSMAPGKKVWECSFDGGKPGQWNEDLAGALGIKDKPTIGYIGTFAPYQGLEMLIEAAAHAHKEIVDIALILVGGTQSEISRLSRMALRHDVAEFVQLIPRQPRQEIADYLALADVLVLPRPKGENAPLKIYEYLMSNKPIVATDIIAHRAVLSDETAIFVAPEPQALAEGILTALNDREHAKKLGLKAAVASGSSDNKSLKTTLEEAYRFVANKRRN
jgi:glycosyltransferase involved in cell wall biosynthesis